MLRHPVLLFLSGVKPIARPLRVNDQIRIRTVRVIDDEGTQLGVMPTEEALAALVDEAAPATTPEPAVVVASVPLAAVLTGVFSAAGRRSSPTTSAPTTSGPTAAIPGTGLSAAVGGTP